MSGKVKWFNDNKGYGFIQTDDGRDVYVHYTFIDVPGFKTLKQAERVTFDLYEGAKGLEARNVRPI